MANNKKLLLTLLVVLLFATVIGTYAWIGAARNNIATEINGSLVSNYFHCGSGTAEDPFIITRPIHYYHMVEFFQRESQIEVEVYTLNGNQKQIVHFGYQKLYFQIGCPEEQLRNSSLRPTTDSTKVVQGGKYFLVDENTEYYVFDYNNAGQAVRELVPGSTEDMQDCMSQELNMAYYSNNNALMPLGTSEKPFYGTFEGNGLTIKNLNIVTTSTIGTTTRSTCDVGIFGVVRKDIDDEVYTIQNTFFENVTIELNGTNGNSLCSILGTSHENSSTYIGYIAGHLYEYNNAQNRDYQLNQVGVHADPIYNVYVNNATITGGTSDISLCEYGYFGHIDLIDDEGAVAISTQVEAISESESGDEGWGGSLDMTSLYNRLYNQIGTSSGSSRESQYPTTETIVISADQLQPAKVSENASTATSRNDNRDTIYYWAATNLVSAGEYVNATGGTIVGSRSSSWIYLYGLKDMGVTATTVYSKTGEVEDAYYISDNGEFLKIDPAGPSITQAELSKNATKFVFDKETGNGTIKSYGENIVYYLKINDQKTGIEVTTDSSLASTWYFYTDTNGKNHIYFKVSETEKYYLLYDNGWVVAQTSTYNIITDGKGHYLSANTTSVLNVVGESDSVSWQVEEGTSGTKFYFAIDSNYKYYLDVVNGKLSITKKANADTPVFWKKQVNGEKAYYYLEQGEADLYLVYDNGWKAQERTGYTISNGNHYLYANIDSITSTTEDNATIFHYEDGDNSTKLFYTIINGTKYYLSNDGTSLTLSTTITNWNVDSAGYYRTVDGFNYYLVYKDGWRLSILTGYKLYYNSQYLTYSQKTVNNQTTYVVSSTTEENACLWQMNKNTIYTQIGNDTYYLILSDSGELSLDKENGNFIWYKDSTGTYTYKNGTDKFYLTYDKGFKATICTGYKISDGNGHFLSKNGSTVGVTNESAATIWQLTNSAIASDTGYASILSYFYTIVGTTRYYLTDLTGVFGFVNPEKNNLVDYSIATKTMTTGKHNMTIEYSKENKSFTLVNSSNSDPFATIDQTVYLEAGKTYYMHLDLSSYAPNSRVQIFYGINKGYSEAQSLVFSLPEVTTKTFTVSTTGTYNFRFDNDFGRQVTISNFYVGEENYDMGPYASLDSWQRDENGYYLITEDSERIYLNYNSTSNKWELITLGGVNIYVTVNSQKIYLSSTGTSITSTNNKANASIWHIDGVGRIYSLVGTTKYYLTYQERITNQSDDSGLSRSIKEVFVTLTTTIADAVKWTEDANGFFMTSSSVKFYLIYDINDSNWKVKIRNDVGSTDKQSRLALKSNLGNSKIYYFSVNCTLDGNGAEVYSVRSETDIKYASVWLYDTSTSSSYKNIYTYSGLTRVYLSADYSSGTAKYGVKFTTSAPTTSVFYGWYYDGYNTQSTAFRTKIDNVMLELVCKEETVNSVNTVNWYIAKNDTFSIYQTISDTTKAYLSVTGTDVTSTTTESNIWTFYTFYKDNKNATQVLRDATFTTDDTADAHRQLIVTLIKGKHYLLASDTNGDLYLKSGVTVYESNSTNASAYYWYLDNMGYYQLVNGVKMYLVYTGTKWIATAPQMLISSSNDLVQVEYIESNGTQYINTGITTSNNNVIELKAYYDAPTPLYGGTASAYTPNAAIIYRDYNYVLFCKNGGCTNYGGTGLIEVRQTNEIVTVNGETYYYSADGNGATGSITFFRAWGQLPNASAAFQYGSYKFYSAKIYTNKGDTLVRDFVPCYKKSTDEYGLYDFVSNKFFANETTTSFTGGEIVEGRLTTSNNLSYNGGSTTTTQEKVTVIEDLPIRYYPLEYIESTGTQYIDTGVTSSDSNVIYLKAYLSQPTALYGTAKSGGYSTNSAVLYRATDHILFLKSNGMSKIYDLGMVEFTQSSSEIVANGVSHSYNSDSNGSVGSITIFRGWSQVNQSVAATFQYGSYKLYAFKIYTDNGANLVRDFVPCYDLVSGVCGVYDYVTKQFYGNSGTGDDFNHPEIKTTYGSSMIIDGVTLPEGYLQLDYITANGSQYINTGVVGVNQNYSIEGYYSFSSLTNNNLWCSRTSTSKATMTVFSLNGSSFRTDYNTSTSTTISMSLSTNTIYKVVNVSNYFIVNNELKYTHNAATFASTNALTLLASYSSTPSSMSSTYTFKGNFYGARVFDENGRLVRYYVPCIEQSTNIVGLYELVTDSFVRSSSSSDFTYTITNSVIGDGSTSSEASSWYYSNGKLYTFVGGSTAYLVANQNGTLSITSDSNNASTFVSSETSDGVSYQTTIQMLDGNQVTYAVYKNGGYWEIAPIQYTTIKYGSSYLTSNGTSSTTSGRLLDTNKLYLTNANIKNDGTNTTALFVIVDHTVYYLTYNATTYEIEFSTTSYTSFSKKNGLYCTSINSNERSIILSNSKWVLEEKQYLTFSSNGVDLGITASGITTTQTRLYTDSNNRVYGLVSGTAYYLIYNNGFSVSTSTTNAMLYNSSTNKIYLNGRNLYYDTYTSSWNVYGDNSFIISSGSNVLRITSTSAFTNITNTSQGSYFSLSDSANHTGTLSTYVNGVIAYLTYNSGLAVSSSSGVTWENIEGAQGSVGVRDVLVYYSGTTGYYITYSNSWTTTTTKNFKMSNVSNGSGTSFLTYTGTEGQGSSSLKKDTKANASVWIFGTGGKHPNGTIYTGSYYYIGYDSSDCLYVSNDRFILSYEYNDTWYNLDDTDVLYCGNDSTRYYLNYSSTGFMSHDSGTKMYFYPDVASSVVHTAPTTITNRVDNSSIFSSITTNQGSSVTSLILSYIGDYTQTTIGSKYTLGKKGQRFYSLVSLYFAVQENITDGVEPNATISSYSGSPNVLSKEIKSSDITNTNTQVNSKSSKIVLISISTIEELPTVTLFKTTDQAYVSSSETYQRGCYIAIRLAKDDNGNYYSDYRADQKNTGYIVGGDYSSASGSGQGDIRVSGYSLGNIENSYDNGAFTTIYTFNDSGLQAINDSANGYTEYERTKQEFLQILSQDDEDVYGIHFMDTLISTNHIITAESVLINGKTYTNYQLPESCIDFNVSQMGTITLYAGDYFSGNSCFFSLNQIIRNKDNTIKEIKEIVEIYKKNNATATTPYLYRYKDNTYSKNVSSAEVASGYTSVFKTSWLTNPNNGSSFSHDYIYYYEVPCNKGEYALGSVEGRKGGYLLYLDIASNGSGSSSYNQDLGITDTPMFTEIDYRSKNTTDDTANYVINSPINFAYTIPGSNTKENFNVSISFDQSYVYTITIVNKTGSEMELAVMLVDNDDDPDNEFPFEYRIIYNGEIYRDGTGYNESSQTYKITTSYLLPLATS